MSYTSEVLADSPSAYWRLGELSGTSAADSSGSGFGGTYNGSPTLGVAGIPGGGGDTAVQFGAGKYVDFGNILDLHAFTQITIECWINLSAWTSQWNPVVTKGDSSWRLAGNDVGTKLEWTVNPSSVASTTSLADSKWHHVAAVLTGASMILYIDGASNASTAFTTAPPATTSATQIARNADQSTRAFGGSIDEVAIYTHALSAARVLAHYNAGITPRLAPITLPAMTALNRAATR